MDTITNAIMCKLAMEKHKNWIIENKTTGNSQTDDSNDTYNDEKQLTDSNTSLTDNRPLNNNSRVDDDNDVIATTVIFIIAIFTIAFISDVIFNTAFIGDDNYIGSWL